MLDSGYWDIWSETFEKGPFCHCEQSEAISILLNYQKDCRVAIAPRNDQKRDFQRSQTYYHN